MALQVWLPLNGSIENKGISTNYIIPNTNYAAWANEGKIGSKSLYPTTTTSGVLSYNGALSNAQSYTICAWIKSIDTSSTSKYIVWTGSDSNGLGFGLRSASNGTIVLFLMFGTAINATVGLNEWHHVAMTINYELLKFSAYLDGTFVNEANYTQKTCSTNTFSVGWLRPSYYPFKGYINDVRVYDTCLSAKEIKEISKGLILHYKLDRNDIGVVGLPYTAEVDYLENNGAAFINTLYVPKGLDIKIACKVTYLGRRRNVNFPSMVKAYVNDSRRCYRLMMRSNTHYLAVLMARRGNNSSENNYLLAVNNTYEITADHYNYTINGTTYTHKDYATSTENTSPLRFMDVDNALNVRFYYFKLWKGEDLIIDMIPVRIGQVGYMYDRVSNQLFGNAGSGSLIPGPDITSLNTYISYDSSGYCNHGSITGTLTTDSDSPRYTASTMFDGSSTIEAPFSPTGPFTISGWFYHSSGTSYYGAKNTPWTYICLEGSRYFLYGSNGLSSLTLDNYTSTANTWLHIVLVYSGSALKLYINGIYMQEKSASNFVYISDILNIGGRLGRGEYVGRMSDFRIYVTALSDDDIKELYNTSAFVTDSGIFAEYELYEDNLSDVKKTGLLETADFYENGAESGYSLDTDKTRVASNYIISEEFIEI